MDIRQLRYFKAIVEERQISAAAKKLHMSQPPLSQQLKAMEEALLEVREVGDGVNGRLSIGVNTFSAVELPDLLRQFQRHYPKVTYTIQQNESSHLCKLVRDRTIELAIIRLPLELGDFSVLHLHTEPFYYIASQQRPPLGHDISLADISEAPLLLPSTEGLGVHYLISEAFSRRELHPRIAGECSDMTLLMELISSDFAAAIVPETVLSLHQGHAIHASRISSDELSSPVGFIWLKHHYLSAAAQHFIDLYRARMSSDWA
ncbi:HTH-type transcriptional regulator GltC [Paenibacillus solanacearum]|uniref:HTH-type transcriptional regulator GltC n=1 Tax=Paenibacillus solanacearum TaxID=2048548 RepID=A0A916JX00_9BACL|nr:LysR family transcriptional regulator [Paenibacillus solanacearum]CAG7610666.1 HTH-type transcriptional regulator GltC [Paenibacillus solanacearum]